MSKSVSPSRGRAMAFAFVLLAIAASPVLAHAQAVGGAGGTFLNGLLTWVQSNVLTTIGTLAIICAGSNMDRRNFVPCSFRSTRGSWRIPSAAQVSAAPSSSPNTITSTSGCNSIQLFSAFR